MVDQNYLFLHNQNNKTLNVLVFLKYIESDNWNSIIEDSKIFNELRII